MCMGILHECMSLHLCQQRQDQGIGYPGFGDTGSCEQPCVCQDKTWVIWKNSPCSSLFEPPLQPRDIPFFNLITVNLIKDTIIHGLLLIIIPFSLLIYNFAVHLSALFCLNTSQTMLLKYFMCFLILIKIEDKACMIDQNI